ncbi:hypothetical protein CDL15_Pgr017596, partial [Punica granatum]
MEILPGPSSYYESLKRYWRRRKYHRLDGARYGSIRRKLKITRLGGTTGHRPIRREYSKVRTAPKLRLKILSPVNLLAKFHEAYTELMIRLAMGMDRSDSSSVIGGNNKIKKGQQVSLVSTGEEVDSKLAMEIYKKFAASRQLA